MVYCKPVIQSVESDQVKLIGEVDGGRFVFYVEKGSMIIVLSDAFPNQLPGAPSLKQFNFDEFISNISVEDGNYEFINELQYIAGITVI